MKTQKLNIFLFGFIFIIFSSTVSAQTNVVRKIVRKKAQEPIEKISNLQNSNNQIVNDSLLDLKGTLANGNNWLMIQITKNNFTQQEFIPVINGNYDARISLQDGPGIYSVGIFKGDTKYGSYIYHGLFTIENRDERDMRFLLPTFKVASDDERIKSLALSLTKDAQNDEEAFIAIYKYVTKNIKYDYGVVEDGTYAQIDFNALYTLQNSKAVCEGYANLVAALSRAYGIRTKVIFGSATNSLGTFPHGWNEVFINDQWKLVDPTWDSIRQDYTYLFMDAQEFAKEHTKEIEMMY